MTKLFRIARRIMLIILLAGLCLALCGVLALLLARGPTLALLVGVRSGTSATLLTVEDERWVDGLAEATGRPTSGSEHFRIGSITKTFVATVVLQLGDEQLVDLDASVETYLPGVVRGGAGITVRQVLQHTSGIPDYMKDEGWSTNRWRGSDRYANFSPDELLRQAFTRPPDFPPGHRFRYSNTNYVVAGMLIESVTGRDYGTEIEKRVLQPLALTGTMLPGSDPRLPEPAMRAVMDVPGTASTDVTEQNETLDWAAGEMISTSADLATFFDALLGGRLLSQQTLDQMRTTVPMGMGFHYGLGLERFDLPCGGQLWGHGGQLLGYVTYAYRRDDGRSFTLLQVSGSDDGFVAFGAMVTAAYCLV
ncbi:MAG: beta-lactamase family protein [Propionibacteriales bacterium]|nr:beta-lactamase family protein [Propionibacteriales bacterium]